jgi:hypothetical protein
MPTHKLTETQLIIKKINNKAASSFIDNCERLRQTLQRREKYPLPLDRSLELGQLDKLMSYIAQQPKTLYWINKSLNIAQAELQNRSKYLNWNKDEWKKWTRILTFLQHSTTAKDTLLDKQIPKRSLTLVMLEMLQEQINKYATYLIWAYQTVAKFWDMPQNSNIKQCWTEQEWHDWFIVLRHITLNLPNDENIAAPA